MKYLKSQLFILVSLSVVVLINCKGSIAAPGSNLDNPPDAGSPIPVNEPALAFPGAEGFGKDATGGRGGKVIKVTNLNDAGSGSLREALGQSGARVIVFEVSGNIVLKSRLQIKNGHVTIAGQTAPGDGICIQNYELQVDADNVIIRFMRFRMGDLTNNQQDALGGRNRQHVIIDHCSISWSIDECASFYSNKNFTMQWCIVAESLNKSFHEKDAHGYGAIWGGTNATFHHNLLAHHNSRNPRFDGGHRSGSGSGSFGRDKVDFYNNVIYNWGDNSAYGGENGEYNIIANYYKAGPGTAGSKRSRILEISYDPNQGNYAPGYGKFYVQGNYVDGNTTVSADNWKGGMDKGSGLSDADYALAKLEHSVTTETPQRHSAINAYNAVLLYSGASFKRDAVDSRIVKEVKDGMVTFNGSKTGKKGIIDSQADVGGWPTLASSPAPLDSDGDGIPDTWEKARKLNPLLSNASKKTLSTSYDDLEVYINSLVEVITNEQSK